MLEADAPTQQAADSDLLDALQRKAFDYFVINSNPRNGLVADTNRAGSPASIAVVGFALSVHPVGVERGWMSRADAAERSLAVLRFFCDSDASGSATATGYRGYFFHFLDMQAGTRVWLSELSLIDTAFLMAGILTAASYFSADTLVEVELRSLADTLYRRVDWTWAQREGGAVTHGWKPESGFLNYGWEGYSEALLLYVLGLGSPTHPLSPQSFQAWTLTYQWENIYGRDLLYAGPLFVHQFSHAWLDLRGIQDDFMREKHCDYFENSRRATLVQRDYAIRNPRSLDGYGERRWGMSAGEGPSIAPRCIAGRSQAFYGYAARGVPFGPDDGTLCGTAILSSLVFAPDCVLPVLRELAASGKTDGATDGVDLILASGFNTTAGESSAKPWVSAGLFGLDQGMAVLMIENYRSGLLWRLSRSNAYLRTGLRRAGFRGGWLQT